MYPNIKEIQCFPRNILFQLSVPTFVLQYGIRIAQTVTNKNVIFIKSIKYHICFLQVNMSLL